MDFIVVVFKMMAIAVVFTMVAAFIYYELLFKTGGKEKMKAAVFQAVCPLEIGDMVAITQEEKETLMYLPKGAMVVASGSVELHTVTDIAALHYLKSSEINFLYELDGSRKYRAYKVKVPIADYAEELKKKDANRK